MILLSVIVAILITPFRKRLPRGLLRWHDQPDSQLFWICLKDQPIVGICSSDRLSAAVERHQVRTPRRTKWLHRLPGRRFPLQKRFLFHEVSAISESQRSEAHSISWPSAYQCHDHAFAGNLPQGRTRAIGTFQLSNHYGHLQSCAEKSRAGSRWQTGCRSVWTEPGIRKIPEIPTTGFQVFFSEVEEGFIEDLEKGITFFTGWGGEESDVPFHIHLPFSEKTTR